MIIPREHGAWGLLLVPLVTGGAVGLLENGNFLPLLLLTVSAIGLFWLRTPLESWSGTGVIRVQTPQEYRPVAVTIICLAATSAFALTALLWNGHNRQLLPLGAIAIFALLSQAILRKSGRRLRMLSQIVGALGLTITAPAAYCVVTGEMNREAWALWMATSMFAANQIHYVQLRIHSARLEGWAQKFEHGRSFLLAELLLIAALVLACRYQFLPWLATVAFLPLLIRGTAWFFERQERLIVRRLGWSELAYAIVFGVCLIASFRLGD